MFVIYLLISLKIYVWRTLFIYRIWALELLLVFFNVQYALFGIKLKSRENEKGLKSHHQCLKVVQRKSSVYSDNDSVKQPRGLLFTID